MKPKISLALGLLLSTFVATFAQNTVITYQGRGTSGGTNFNGTGQFKFALVTSTNFSQQATATANPPSGGFITIINVTFGGNGYVTPPVVSIFGGGGAGATATATVSGGVVTAITVNNPGSGYTSTPTVTVAPPPPNVLYTTYWSNDGTSVNGSEPSAAINVPVTDGLFTALLGDTSIPNMAALNSVIFIQPNLQLRIWFNNGVHGFAALNPPQPLTPAPYAVQAIRANNLLGTISATQLTGTIPAAQLGGNYSSAVNFSNQSNSFSGSFSGNGGNLTNVPAGALAFTSTNLSVVAWGLESEPDFPVFDVPSDLVDPVALAAGYVHSLALRQNGTVVAWGGGQTNDPSSYLHYGQSIVPAGLTNVTRIAGGIAHSLALRNDGTVVAWGAGFTNDASGGFQYGQSLVPLGLNNVAAIAAGAVHSLAVRSNGTVVAWGAGGSGPIYTNLYDHGQSVVPGGLNNVVAVAGGLVHSLALRSDGTVVAWGGGGSGPTATNQLDVGQSVVPPGLNNVVAIAAGGIHSVALKADGTIIAWGGGMTNDPGSGVHYGQSIVPPGLSNVVAITAGFVHTVALKSDGTLVAWGASDEGVDYGQADVPPGLNNVVGLATSSMALHTIALRKRSSAPVAWLDSDNTFNGSVTVNGNLDVSGELSAGGNLRLDDGDIWLRGGADTKNGLGWYGEGKGFGGEFIEPQPDGPILFGATGGALATRGTNGTKIALAWDSSQRVGIGTTTPSAQLSLGTAQAASKLLIYDSFGQRAGLGFSNSTFRLHLPSPGNSFAFFDAPTGNELVRIQSFGSVGIGTPTPNAKLDVRGDVRLGSSGQFYAPGGVENLRIIRGRIAGNGTITTGTGFTVTKTGTGAYTVTFSTSFASEPTITATPQVGLARIATCTNVGASAAQFRTFDSASGSAIDQDFHFIAIGPR